MSDGDPLEQAARIDDPVEHSWAITAFIVGALAGIALGLLCATGVGMIVTLAVMGSGLAGWAAKKWGPQYSAPGISTGAPTVTVGGRDRNAGRVLDEVKCDSEVIISGCETITIETRLAARATEKTRCDGTIEKDKCCPTVYYGGPSLQIMATRINGELPMLLWAGREVVGFVFGGGFKMLGRLARPSSWRAMARLVRMRGWIRGGYLVADNILEFSDLGLKAVRGTSEAIGWEEGAMWAESVESNPYYKGAQDVRTWRGRVTNPVKAVRRGGRWGDGKV